MRYSKIVVLFLICFLIAHLQGFFLSYSRVVAVEQPILDRLNDDTDKILNTWMTSFNEEHMNSAKDFLEQMYLNKSEIEECNTIECLESIGNREYAKLMNEDNYVYEVIDRCLESHEENCKIKKYDYCNDKAEIEKKCNQYVINTVSLSILAGSTFVPHLMEGLSAVENVPSVGQDEKVAKVLGISFNMAIAAIKTAWVTTHLTEEKEYCYDYYNETNLTDLEVEILCVRKPHERIDKFTKVLEKNLTYVPSLETQDCAQYNMLKVMEKWRLTEQSKIDDTTLPYLRMFRTMDTIVLNKCNPKLLEFADTLTCVKPKSFTLTSYAIAQTMTAAAVETDCVTAETTKIKEYFSEWNEHELERDYKRS